MRQDPAQDPGNTDHSEAAARAEMYGLLASLFYAPPTPALLDGLAVAPLSGKGVLGSAWADLVALARQMPIDAVRSEFDRLFNRVGRPEVPLYGAYYVSGFLMAQPRAALRADLARLGLARPEGVPENEDHLSSLCVVMRHLIVSDDAGVGRLAAQKAFFSAHLQPWVERGCDAVLTHPSARFYAALATVAKTFFTVEAQTFSGI